MICRRFSRFPFLYALSVFTICSFASAQDLVLESVRPGAISDTSVEVEVAMESTNRATVFYGTSISNLAQDIEVSESAFSRKFSFQLKGLERSSKYYYFISTQEGNSAVFTFTTLADTLKPQAYTLGISSTQIDFSLPDFAPAYIAFGTTPDQLDMNGPKEFSSKYKDHNQVLAGLVVGQKYYFRVRSGQQFQNSSHLYTFVHQGENGPAEVTSAYFSLELVGTPELHTRTSSSTKIDFTLQEKGPAYVAFGTSMDSLSQQGSVERGYEVDEHSQVLSGLIEGQRYYYQIVAGDNFQRRSAVMEFTHPNMLGQNESTATSALATSQPEPEPVAIAMPIQTNPSGAETSQAPETEITVTNNGNQSSQAVQTRISIPEPQEVGAGQITGNATRVYVEVGGRGNGSSVSSPMGDIQRAFDSASPGTIIYVKAGNYGNQRLILEGNGSAGAPIILEGYRDRPGDSPRYGKFDHTSPINSSIMPLLDGGSRTNGGTAIRISGQYVALRNFQATNFRNGVFGSGRNHSVDNIVAVNLGDPEQFYHGHGIFMTGPGNRFLVRDSVVVNAGAQAYTLKASNSIFEGNHAYCDDNSTGHDSATDYYFNVTEAFDNIIRNNHIERVGDLDHGGHGFQVKGIGERNLFENNTAVNIDGGGISARHSEAKNNIFRNNTLIGGSGILVRDEASGNLFENNTVEGSSYGIWITDSVERGRNGASNGNTFRNNTIRNVRRSAIEYRSTWGDPDSWSFDDVFDGITIDGAPVVFQADHRTRNITARNFRIRNVPTWVQSRSPRTPSEFTPNLSNITVQDNSFTVPR